MADGTDEGDLRIKDGEGDGLFVERPEIFLRAAAATDDEDIEIQPVIGGVDVPYGGGDLFGSAGALDGNGRDEQLCARPAIINTLCNIDQGGAGPAGNYSDPHRIGGKRLFMVVGEKTLVLEAFIHLVKGQLQVANAGLFEDINVKLVLALRGIQVDMAGRQGRDAVFGGELYVFCLT